ncbi:uncharacterized protein LOC117322358 [Pecten maximus]|uniref:uncharacterized protein LOC117322358 n=1 Tax=Pecten maximus TaxID=6579 RepID=UPI001458FA61|nr:uncharacterized protein LOC117322358 [Pecten maximus]
MVCPLVVLMAVLLAFVSGHSPPNSDTGCDVVVLRLENMVADLTKRVDDLENQRLADTMYISGVIQEMKEVKDKNRRLERKLDRILKMKSDGRTKTIDWRIDSTKYESQTNLQSATFENQSDTRVPTLDQKANGNTSIVLDENTDSDSIAEEKEVKTDDTSTSKNQGRIRRNSSAHSTILAPHQMNRVGQQKPTAFFTTLGHTLNDVAREQVIIFESIIVNNGGHYDEHTGVFTCDTEGTYVFSWTIYTINGGYIHSDLVKNGNVFASSLAGDQNFNEASSTTAVVNLIPGDKVWTRITASSAGADVLASKSSLCGFKI